ncbi:MAG: DUF4240 domain-containing protein [Candidatus Melainabacteria bacterium]|nr:MAG: DUF4240 domain-containing protein [Candidatus Melainabacteria bacterium]
MTSAPLLSIMIRHTRHGGWNRHEAAIQKDIQKKLNDLLCFEELGLTRYKEIRLKIEFSDRDGAINCGPLSCRRELLCAKVERDWRDKTDSDFSEMEAFIGESVSLLLLGLAVKLELAIDLLFESLPAILNGLSKEKLIALQDSARAAVAVSDAGSMTEEIFWQLVEKTRDTNISVHAENLLQALTELNPGEIIDFAIIQNRMLARAFRWDLWAVVYIAYDGCSDDSFESFRAWMLSLGQKNFHRSLGDPQFLVSQLSEILPSLEPFEEDFLMTVATAYEEKTGWSVADVLSRDELSFDTEITGQSWDEDKVCLQFPSICKGLNHQH